MNCGSSASDNLASAREIHAEFVRTPAEKAMQFIADHGDEVRAHIKKCDLCAHKYQETIDRYVESLPEKKRMRLRTMARVIVRAISTKQ